MTAGSGNDSVVDTPTPYGFDTGVGGSVRGNYATFNPLAAPVTSTVSNGNLFVSRAGGASSGSTLATIGVTSGKYYWEIYMNSNAGTAGGLGVGIVPFNFNYATGWVGEASTSTGYWGNGAFYGNHTGGTTPATYTVGDTIGIALDMDALTVSFYKNGVATGGTITGIQNNALPAICMFDAVATSMIANFGQRPFAYTAPSGFKALCTTNLPTPAVGGSSETLASKFFAPVLWAGNGANPRNITGVGFQPDLVWIKGRAASGHYWQDAVRGVTSTDSRSLSTHSTAAETNYFPTNGMMNAFISDGFTTAGGSTNDNANASGANYVAWNWKANGAGSTNTAGSITSTVSANQRSGFSIVTYTGTGANATVGHGLGVTPAMYITKKRNSTSDWAVYHQGITGSPSYVLQLQATDAAINVGVWWNSTSPTSSLFSLGNSSTVNGSGDSYVAYCFAEVPGFSKFGSYTGNGSADGAFVHLGFRPAFMIIKASSAADDWAIIDVARSPYNAVNLWLNAEDTSSEATLSPAQFDIVSNGLKLRGTSSTVNGNGTTYIYMAFASNPFKYSLAR